MPKPKTKPVVEQEPVDYLTEKTGAQLREELDKIREDYEKELAKRNYLQMDRDMIENFYLNTKKECEMIDIEVKNKESECHQQEEDHQVEVKVYLQKVKHLEYEQERNNKQIQDEGENAKQSENQYFYDRLNQMKDIKSRQKKEYLDNERKNISDVNEEKNKLNKYFQIQEQQYNEKIKIYEQKQQKRLADLKEELELKLKVELHELEERKNLHINQLMNNHEKAFAELKKYYNDITAENLNLIKSQKEEIARINSNELSNTKLITEMKLTNDNLKKPLEIQQKTRDDLKAHLKQFPKHKMSLFNIMSKHINLKDKINKLQNDREELDQKYEAVIKQKQKLQDKFEQIVSEVKKHSELQNIVLDSKLEQMESELQQKEVQLQQVMEKAKLDPNLYKDLQIKIQDSIESKNNLIKSLKYSIHHATKAYNDANRVYSAKLVEFGIPAEELGFQELETITSNMPAGLVSS